MKIELESRPALVRGTRHPDARDDQDLGTDAERIIERAGRECYDSWGKGRSSEAYHKHILEVGHDSVLAHVSFTFRVSGVSRPLTMETNRHHVGTAISQRSTRYCDESESDVIEHPALIGYGASDDAQKAIAEALAAAQKAYVVVAEDVEGRMIASGVDKATARKQARAAARMYLPTGLETSLIWSANVRALRNIIAGCSNSRATSAADAETRAWAIAVWRCVQAECPAYFAATLAPAADGLGEVLMWL